MSDPVNSAKLNRRSMLLGAVFLVGGAAALSRFTRTPSPGTGGNAQVFSSDQYALLEQVTDVIIPTTDTPGAIGAGVPVFIREMLTSWGSKESRAEFLAVLDAIEKDAWAKHGAPFLELAAERRTAVMREFDLQRVTASDQPYRKFKYIVLLGYYHSEVGATQELRFELVPGAWRSCVPLTEIGRASAVW